MNQRKAELLAKIINPKTKRVVMIPMDHGVSDGPIKGLDTIEETLIAVRKAGVDAVVLHKGIYKRYKEQIGDLPVLIHISASTTMGVPLRKVIIATPNEVKALGAQGVSIHINMANRYEPEMLRDLGRVSGECEKLGLPLLAMMYPRMEKDGAIVTFTNVEHIAHAARVAAELGADIVKVPYTGSPETFKLVVDSCPIPVLIAGGAKGSEEAMLESISGCVKVGAAGVSCGRNVFQHEDIAGIVQKIKRAVHGFA
jgi:predicted phospho-2-dehydro-3-deoxyheptonate aldolase